MARDTQKAAWTPNLAGRAWMPFARSKSLSPTVLKISKPLANVATTT